MNPEGEILRWVLLRHDLPSGGWHFDWMLQRSSGAEGLLTFRVESRPDQPGFGFFEADRLDDHRTAYLDYEGEVSGGRGSVRRVASGVLVSLDEEGGRLEVEIDVEGERWRWLGVPMEPAGKRWVFAGQTRQF